MKRGCFVISLFFLSMLFSACNIEEKVENRLDRVTTSLETIAKSTQVLAQRKERGFKCDDKEALKLLKEIVHKQYGSKFEIDRDNIIIWNQNSVGRYTCKAKINRIKKKKKKSSTDNDLVHTVLGKMFATDRYGVGKDGGWINYYTYLTTTEKKRVELILPEEKEE